MAEDDALAGDTIASLRGPEQARLILELTDYADFLIRTKAQWIQRGVLPRGYDASSLALEALTRVLDGRRRPWDPDTEATLLDYLKSVVKSIFSEILRAATQASAEVAGVDDEGRDIIAPASMNPGVDAELERAQLEEEILGQFDESDDQLVLLCIFSGVVKPAEIAESTGLDVQDVYRIKQKLKRRLSYLQRRA